MPRITKEQLNNVQYVSMEDFCRQVDQIEHIDDKRKFATEYLLKYGLNGPDKDYSFVEAVHIAKMKLGETTMKLKYKLNNDLNQPNPSDLYYGKYDGAVNVYAKTKDEDIANELFMGDPGKYLQGYALAKGTALEEKGALSEAETKLKDHYLNLASSIIDDNVSEKVEGMESLKKLNQFDANLRMKVRFGGKEALDKIVANTKAGTMSRLFNTSSLAAKNLETVYAAFNNPNHAMFGDLKAVEKAGNDYLQHKFPSYKPGGPLPTEEELARLDKTSRARAMLSIGLVEAAKEEKPLQENFVDLVKENKAQDHSFTEVVEAEERLDKIAQEKLEADQIMEDIAKADQENALKDELGMNLQEESFVQLEDDDDEKYAQDDEDPEEEAIINAADELGESFLETENIAKAKAEEERIRQWEAQKAFQEKLKEDLEMDENVHIDVSKQEAALLKERREIYGDDYELDLDEYYKGNV